MSHLDYCFCPNSSLESVLNSSKALLLKFKTSHVIPVLSCPSCAFPDPYLLGPLSLNLCPAALLCLTTVTPHSLLRILTLSGCSCLWISLLVAVPSAWVDLALGYLYTQHTQFFRSLLRCLFLMGPVLITRFKLKSPLSALHLSFLFSFSILMLCYIYFVAVQSLNCVQLFAKLCPTHGL